MNKKTKYGIAAIVIIALLAGFTMFFPKGLLEQFVDNMDQAPAAPVEKPIEPPSYVEMETFTIPVIDQGEIKTTVFLSLQLDVAKEDFVTVKSDMRRLHDYVLRDLHDFLPKHMNTRPTPDLYVVKQHLQTVIGRATGGKVRDVVIKGSFNR